MALVISGTTGTRGFGRLPLSNIVPFSYRDGATFADILYGLRDYMTETIHPDLTKNLNAVIEQLNVELREMGAEIISGQDQMQSVYDVFASEVERRIMLINNKTGVIDIQRVMLVNNDYTLTIDSAWPDNHRVPFVLTQDSVGGRTVKLGSMINGPLFLNTIPGMSTEITLVPNGSGKWDIHTAESNLFSSGNESLANLPDTYNVGTGGTVVAIGSGAMRSMTEVKNSIAIGADTLSQGTKSRDNIAIGDSSLRNTRSGTASYSQSDRSGTRNIGIGGNALHFNEGGYGHVGVGRNAAHCIIDGTGLVAVGSNANGGYAPIGLTGIIENGAPWGAKGQVIRTVAVGNEALNENTAPNVVAVGGHALRHNKKSDNNVAIGARALFSLDIDTGMNGGQNVELSLTGTYSQTGNVLTLDIANHGLAAGDIVNLRLLDGGSATFGADQAKAVISSVPTTSKVTIQHPISRSATGSAQVYSKETAAKLPTNGGNIGIGTSVGGNMKTALGTILIGTSTAEQALTGSQTVAVGELAFRSATDLSNSVAVGFMAGSSIDRMAERITAVGASALRNNTDGTPFTGEFTNVAGLGYDTRATASNQVQLGNANTTTYTYGAVQNRSDVRDKTEIRDTVLGLDFINELRPVDFKFNYREEDENGERYKGKRFHHGVIAQEVQSVIQESGTDFGGFQDHNMSGGGDVLSVGYTEFIAPLIKAVQELTARIVELESK